MVTKDGRPEFVFGVMGGDMQPQGHGTRVYPPGRPVGQGIYPSHGQGFAVARSLPDRLGRNEFTLLRTDHSPQIALHPSSRKRSYHCWFQGGNVTPDGTCTHLFKRLHRRTSLGRKSQELERPHRRKSRSDDRNATTQCHLTTSFFAQRKRLFKANFWTKTVR